MAKKKLEDRVKTAVSKFVKVGNFDELLQTDDVLRAKVDALIASSKRIELLEKEISKAKSDANRNLTVALEFVKSYFNNAAAVKFYAADVEKRKVSFEKFRKKAIQLRKDLIVAQHDNYGYFEGVKDYIVNDLPKKNLLVFKLNPDEALAVLNVLTKTYTTCKKVNGKFIELSLSKNLLKEKKA